MCSLLQCVTNASNAAIRIFQGALVSDSAVRSASLSDHSIETSSTGGAKALGGNAYSMSGQFLAPNLQGQFWAGNEK